MSELEIFEKSQYLTVEQLSKISGKSKEDLLLILLRLFKRDREIQALSMSGVRESSLICKKCGGYFGVNINHRCFKCLEKLF